MTCECGCGLEASPGKRFVSGHNAKFTKHTNEKAERNALLRERLQAGGGRGTQARLAREFGLSHTRIQQLAKRMAA